MYNWSNNYKQARNNSDIITSGDTTPDQQSPKYFSLKKKLVMDNLRNPTKVSPKWFQIKNEIKYCDQSTPSKMKKISEKDKPPGLRSIYNDVFGVNTPKDRI